MKADQLLPNQLRPFPTAWPSEKERFDFTNETHQDLLDNVQAGILRAHGRKCACIIFFQLGDAEEKNREALQAAAWMTTSALAQRKAAQAHLEHAEDLAASSTPVLTLALSAAGMRKCGCGDDDLPGDSHGRPAQDFADGMASARDPDRLMDPPQSTWEEPLNADAVVHGAWLVASSSGATLREESGRVKKWIKKFGGTPIGEPQECGTWRPGPIPAGAKQPPSREPFGFVDGISVPHFFAHEGPNHPSICLPVSRVLIADDSVHRGGSFLVVRRLEQNVKAFREFEAAVGDGLDKAGRNPADAGQLLVGRNRSGVPQLMSGVPTPKDLNDFDFNADTQNRGCPFDAHIRKANARTQDARNEWSDRDGQIVRRSMVYGIENLTLEGPPWPEGGVGLWFMAYMRDIESQFLMQHRFWLRSLAHPLNTGAGQIRYSDFLTYGGRDLNTYRDPQPQNDWSWGGARCTGFTNFVKFKGGEFLFVPSRLWLANGGR